MSASRGATPSAPTAAQLAGGNDTAPAAAPAGALVAAAVAVHAMLHGQEAPGHLLWWLGAALGSGGVLLGSFALLRRLGAVWTGRLALALCLGGGVLVLLPNLLGAPLAR